MNDAAGFAFHDLAPGEESFRDAVLAGLGRQPKTLPCKFFYDEKGSALFEEICEVHQARDFGESERFIAVGHRI